MVVKNQESSIPTVIRNNIKNLVDEAYGKNISAFASDCKISYTTALDLYHDRAKAISINIMNKLCNRLGVGPGELFVFTPDYKGVPDTKGED